MATERDAAFVEEVTKLLVEHPESVEVNRTIDDLGVLITLKVHPDDMATIIGREGRSAKAIRTLLRIIGAKEDQRVNLKIVEPDGSDHRREESGESAAEAPTETPAEAPVEDSTPVEDAPSAQAADVLDDLPDSLV